MIAVMESKPILTERKTFPPMSRGYLSLDITSGNIYINCLTIHGESAIDLLGTFKHSQLNYHIGMRELK